MAQRRPVVVLAVCFLSVGLAGVALASDEVVEVGGYSFALSDHWALVDSGMADPGIVAIRTSEEPEGQQLGELLAATLSGPLDEEMQGMVDSVPRSKGRITILRSGDFVTDGSLHGRRLSLLMDASDPNYGRPLVLDSVYLPGSDGGSVTFKLRSSQAGHRQLVAEFEAMVRTATKE